MRKTILVLLLGLGITLAQTPPQVVKSTRGNLVCTLTNMKPTVTAPRDQVFISCSSGGQQVISAFIIPEPVVGRAVTFDIHTANNDAMTVLLGWNGTTVTWQFAANGTLGQGIF